MVVDPSGLSSPPVAHESGRRALLLVVLALVMVALVARVMSSVSTCSSSAAVDVADLDDDDLARVELTL
jgi:hypothetical protein